MQLDLLEQQNKKRLLLSRHNDPQLESALLKRMLYVPQMQQQQTVPYEQQQRDRRSKEQERTTTEHRGPYETQQMAQRQTMEQYRGKAVAVPSQLSVNPREEFKAPTKSALTQAQKLQEYHESIARLEEANRKRVILKREHQVEQERRRKQQQLTEQSLPSKVRTPSLTNSGSSSSQPYINFLEKAKHDFMMSNPHMSEEELNRAWSQAAIQQLQQEAPQHSQNGYKDTQSSSLPDASADFELYQGPNAQFIPLSISPPPDPAGSTSDHAQQHRDRSAFTKALDGSTPDNATASPAQLSVNDVAYPQGQERSPSIPSWRNHLPNLSSRQKTPVSSDHYPGKGMSSVHGSPTYTYAELLGDGTDWRTEPSLPRPDTQPLYPAQRQQDLPPSSIGEPQSIGVQPDSEDRSMDTSFRQPPLKISPESQGLWNYDVDWEAWNQLVRDGGVPAQAQKQSTSAYHETYDPTTDTGVTPPNMFTNRSPRPDRTSATPHLPGSPPVLRQWALPSDEEARYFPDSSLSGSPPARRLSTLSPYERARFPPDSLPKARS